MLLSGDEFANTQSGNNNAYCQDNETSWLDWSGLEKHRDLYDFARRLIAFRNAHPVLRDDSHDFGKNSTGYPGLSFHGTKAWDIGMDSPGHAFAYLYAEDHTKYGTEKDCFIYVAVNAHWEEHEYELPGLPEGYGWYLAFYSNGESYDSGGEKVLKDARTVSLTPRSSAVLIGKKTV